MTDFKPLEFVKDKDELKTDNGTVTVRQVSNKEKNTTRYYLDGFGGKSIMVGVNKNGQPYLAKVDSLRK